MNVPLPTQQATRVRYFVLAWACSLSLITYIDRVCIKDVAGDIMRDLNLSSQQFSWIFSAFGVSYALFEVPTGWLGDRMGPRKVLCRIVLWWSIFTVLTGLVYPFQFTVGQTVVFNSWMLMILVRFLFGMGEAGAYPNMSRALRSWFPYERRGFAQGMMWTFARWGGAAAAGTIALLSSTQFGWRGAFWALGIIGIIWVSFFWQFFRDTPRQHPAANDEERLLAQGKAPPTSLWQDLAPIAWPGALLVVGLLLMVAAAIWNHWDVAIVVPSTVAFLWLLLIGASFFYVVRHAPGAEVAPQVGSSVSPQPHVSAVAAENPAPLSWGSMVGSPTLWFLSVMYFCSNAGWCFFITWDRRYYESVLRLEGNALQIASSAPLFSGGIACLIGGLVTDRMVQILGRRWGRTLQGAIAYAFGGVFFLLAMYAEDPVWSVVLLCLASFGKDFAMGVSWATCIDIGHRYSGTVSGFMNMVGNMGTAVAPPIVAFMASGGGGEDWHYALLFSAIVFFVAALGWIFINPKHVIVYGPADEARLREQGAL